MKKSPFHLAVPAYGIVPAQTTPAQGEYTDSIVATRACTTGGMCPATTTFTVTANISPTCTISAGDLQFLSYTGAQLDAQSQLVVTCANLTMWNVGLNQGTYPGATVTTRKMTGPQPSALLSYSLYRGSARTLNWGNTGGTDAASGTGTGGPQTLPVYGRIPPSQSPIAGGYKDTITATLTF